MNLTELVSLALEALKRNMVRTMLTMLGIIIGIASVIIIISLGQGTQQSILEEISSFGANIITVSPGQSERGPISSGSTITTLTRDDARALETLPGVAVVGATVSTNKVFVSEGNSMSVSIQGVEYGYAEINDLSVVSGSFFDPGDIDSLAKVVIIGDEVVTELYGEGSDVIGESVRVDGKTFRIIGVIPDSSSALMPISTVQKILLSQSHVGGIQVLVPEIEMMDAVEDRISETLLLEHDIDEGEEPDFSIRNSQELLSSVSSITGMLTGMLSGIAAISLVVGGIGIMNIMLVTVTERTREIGLLKAIGAKRRAILYQFLIEAVVLTLAGGAVGIVLGIGITWLASSLLSIPFAISLQSISLSLGVSAAVGILFGWYPAQRAARLQPIDALRHE